jgi:hypothetical protein
MMRTIGTKHMGTIGTKTYGKSTSWLDNFVLYGKVQTSNYKLPLLALELFI